MKNIYSTVLLVLTVLFSYHEITAQPTLTNLNTSPQVGEIFISHTIDTAGVTEGNAGANITWDFSGLLSTGTDTTTAVNPATTPYGSSFPNSNISFESGGNYVYYGANSSSYSYYGAYIASQNVAISYSDPEIIFNYPYTYNSTHTDLFESTFINGGTTFYRKGTITGLADGYGTLILPNGTFSNVLRIKLVEDYQDSANVMGIPQVFEYDTELFLWYQPGTHSQLLETGTFTSNFGGTFSFGNYLDQSSVNINETLLSEYDFKMFPNPATTFTNIKYRLKEPSDVKISIYNILGQESAVLFNKKQASGSYIQTINLEDLDKGVYLMWIEINGNIETKKIAIIK